MSSNTPNQSLPTIPKEHQNTHIVAVEENITATVDTLIASTTQSLPNISNDVQSGIQSFVTQYILSESLEEKNQLTSLMIQQTSRLADDGNRNQVQYFLHAYLTHADLNDNVPPLDDIIDIAHTDMLLSYIHVLSQKTASQRNINTVIDKLYENYSIDDILSTAKSLQGPVFMRTLACELVRGVIKYGSGVDRSIDIHTSESEHYKGYLMNKNSFDLYNLFYKPSEFSKNMEYADFLPADDPLIEILEKIWDYNDELYEDIISRIKEYYIETSSLGLVAARAFKELVDDNIDEAPKNIKSQYQPTLGFESKYDQDRHLLDQVVDDENMTDDDVIDPHFDAISDQEFEDIILGTGFESDDNF